MARVWMKTGGHQGALDLHLVLDSRRNIVAATLVLARSWMGDEHHLNPFATDIAGSFIAAVAPETDADAALAFRDALNELRGSADEVVTFARPSDALKTIPRAVDLQRAFLGNPSEFTFAMSGCRLQLHSTDATREITLSTGIQPTIIYGNIDSPNGATISEQADLIGMLSGATPTVLVNSKYAALEPMFAKALFTPDELVANIVIAETVSEFPISDVTVFDGRVAHSITVVGVSADGTEIVYRDSWPTGSFLQEGNNEAGLKARPATDTPGAWLVPSIALPTVIYAVLFMPPTWDDVTAVINLLAQPDEAVRAQLKVHAQNPTDRRSSGQAWLSIAGAFAIEKRLDEQVAALRVATALEPNSARIAVSLCDAMHVANDEGTIATCHSALALINKEPGLSAPARAALKREIMSHSLQKRLPRTFAPAAAKPDVGNVPRNSSPRAADCCP